MVNYALRTIIRKLGNSESVLPELNACEKILSRVFVCNLCVFYLCTECESLCYANESTTLLTYKALVYFRIVQAVFLEFLTGRNEKL